MSFQNTFLNTAFRPFHLPLSPSTQYCSVNSTSHKASHYTIFSILYNFLPLWSKQSPQHPVLNITTYPPGGGKHLSKLTCKLVFSTTAFLRTQCGYSSTNSLRNYEMEASALCILRAEKQPQIPNSTGLVDP